MDRKYMSPRFYWMRLYFGDLLISSILL
ncbi:hypothetical protein Goari_026759 [Gossypium aridum]|uniref:Uncharacterized protein n=1 Tax=Gossypium aridum TaxID=34290 RepID=A0A7J8YU70_GOSAI|nr:hypothetical protein [Gossypium aridum]